MAKTALKQAETKVAAEQKRAEAAQKKQEREAKLAAAEAAAQGAGAGQGSRPRPRPRRPRSTGSSRSAGRADQGRRRPSRQAKPAEPRLSRPKPRQAPESAREARAPADNRRAGTDRRRTRARRACGRGSGRRPRRALNQSAHRALNHDNARGCRFIAQLPGEFHARDSRVAFEARDARRRDTAAASKESATNTKNSAFQPNARCTPTRQRALQQRADPPIALTMPTAVAPRLGAARILRRGAGQQRVRTEQQRADQRHRRGVSGRAGGAEPRVDEQRDDKPTIESAAVNARERRERSDAKPSAIVPSDAADLERRREIAARDFVEARRGVQVVRQPEQQAVADQLQEEVAAAVAVHDRAREQRARGFESRGAARARAGRRRHFRRAALRAPEQPQQHAMRVRKATQPAG